MLPSNCPIPGFFIVGSMKCGTTVLYESITQHPDSYPAKEKEIHFFSLNSHLGMDWYLDHFSKAGNKFTGEASPTYFDIASTQAIPKAIKESFPEAKIILIVRDPVERAVSHFLHLKKINKVDALADMDVNEFFDRNFETALSEVSDHDFYLSRVLNFSLYFRKYQNYRAVFGHDSILVLTNEELLIEPQSTMERVFTFLEMAPFKAKGLNKFRYSVGTAETPVNKRIEGKLRQFFMPNFKAFSKATGIKPLQPPGKKAVDVHVGREGWLFLKGGANTSMDFYTGKAQFSDELIKRWESLLHTRKQWMDQHGITYRHVIVPNKLTLYPEFSDIPLTTFSKSPLHRLRRNIARTLWKDVVIDPQAYLTRLKEKSLLYWKTDSHWTYQGCFVTYQLICSAFGIKPRADLLNRPYKEMDISLDLGNKLKPSVYETVRYYDPIQDSKRCFANDLVKYKEKNNVHHILHGGTNVIYRNTRSGNELKIVIFGDSFSEYRPVLLTGMMAETFAETHFVWSTSLDYEYIEKTQPDLVLTEIVERFLPDAPNDNFDLDASVTATLKRVNTSA